MNLHKKRDYDVKRAQDDKVDQMENLYRELVGVDDASLLKEIAEAEEQWEEEKLRHPNKIRRLVNEDLIAGQNGRIGMLLENIKNSKVQQ